MLRYYDGVGAVRLLKSDEAALLMEHAMGKRSLMSMATSGRDVEAARILADTAAALLEDRVGAWPALLTPLAGHFAPLFIQEAVNPTLRSCAEVTRELLATQQDIRPLHGDLHHDNVLDAQRGWLAIDPKGVIGDRAYEVANLLRNPWHCGAIVHNRDRMKRIADLYSRRLDIAVERVLGFAFAHAGLTASWDIEDGEDPRFSLDCANVLSPLLGI